MTLQGGLAGLLSGLALSMWVCIGAQIYHPLPENSRPLDLSTRGCNLTFPADGLNWTIGPTERTKDDFVLDRCVPKTIQLQIYSKSISNNQLLNRPWLADNWYSVSYLYFCPMGTLAVVIVGLIVSIFSGTRHPP